MGSNTGHCIDNFVEFCIFTPTPASSCSSFGKKCELLLILNFCSAAGCNCLIKVQKSTNSSTILNWNPAPRFFDKITTSNPFFLWLRILLDTLATLCGDEIFLTIPSPARILRFSRRNWPFPVLSAVNCLLRCHGHSLLLFSYFCRIKRENSSCSACGLPLQGLSTSPLTVPHPSLSDAPSLAVLLPFFTSVPNLGRGPTVGSPVEFLHAPIPRKGSGSTTTTTNPFCSNY